MKANFNGLNFNKKNSLAVFAVALSLAIFPTTSFAFERVAPEPVRVKLGEVVSINVLTHTFTISVASSSNLTIKQSASTTIFTGNGDETSMDSIKKGSKIYVFGIINDDTMKAEKVVIKNPSKLSRDNLKEASSVSENTDAVDMTFLAFLSKIWKGVTFTTAYGADKFEQSFNTEPDVEADLTPVSQTSRAKLSTKEII